MAFATLKLGDNAPEVINVVIEIPKGTSNKYEYDEELDEIRLDRVLHSPMFYPADYGFIPETRSEDGDHLDVLVLISQPTFPGCILEVRTIGLLDMEDENGQDEKIIAVATKDPHYEDIASIDDVNGHLKKEIVHFFEAYKTLENKWAKVKGWHGKDLAMQTITASEKRFGLEASRPLGVSPTQ